jgi:hypothetical protein
MCIERLGADAFARVYDLLKAHSAATAPRPSNARAIATYAGEGSLGGGYAVSDREHHSDSIAASAATDDDAGVERAIEAIVGRERLVYWPLVDQLLFCEELNQMQRQHAA